MKGITWYPVHTAIMKQPVGRRCLTGGGKPFKNCPEKEAVNTVVLKKFGLYNFLVNLATY